MKRWMILALFSVNILALPGIDEGWDHADHPATPSPPGTPVRSEPTLEQTERIQKWVAQIPTQDPVSVEVERGLEGILKNPKTYYLLACCALAGALTLKSK